MNRTTVRRNSHGAFFKLPAGPVSFASAWSETKKRKEPALPDPSQPIDLTGPRDPISVLSHEHVSTRPRRQGPRFGSNVEEPSTEGRGAHPPDEFSLAKSHGLQRCSTLPRLLDQRQCVNVEFRPRRGSRGDEAGPSRETVSATILAPRCTNF